MTFTVDYQHRRRLSRR